MIVGVGIFYENEKKELYNFDLIKNETRKFDLSQGQPGIIYDVKG